MNRKVVTLFITNFIFYLFIILHSLIFIKYGDDFLVQVLLYIALSFSTIVMEEGYRKDIIEIKYIAILDFILRLVVLIIHFIYMIFNLNLILITFITVAVLLLNILVELIILKKSWNMHNDFLEIINKKELDAFINMFFTKKIDNFKIGTKMSKEISEMMIALKISGKGNIVVICLFFLLYVSHFINKFLNHFLYLDILIVNLFVLIFIKVNTNFIKMGFKEEANITKKIIIGNLSFVIGYIILFLCEAIFYEKVGYFRVSIWVFAILTFMPTFNRKYLINQKLQIVYKKYTQALD